MNYHNYQGLSIHLDGNSDKKDGNFLSNTGGKLVDFMEYSRCFQDLPKPRYPSHANSRDKKSLNSSTQAKLEEQLEEQHRQGAAVQPYPVIT